jgi:putative hydrolase of the HAD superfamily
VTPPPSASRPDLRHVDTWIFDLDNTLYPPGTGFVALIEEKMTDYTARATGLPRAEALALQLRYLEEHGTTLAGLMRHHGVDAADFLDKVHDVSTEVLTPDPRLKAAVQRLPGRRLVFTNGHGAHAERVLEALQIAELFDEVFHLESGGLIPKPRPEAFDRLVAAHAVTPATAAFFEDTERNLKPAAALGMTTVLIGPHALTSTAPFVQHRAQDLAPFLEAALVQDPR